MTTFKNFSIVLAAMLIFTTGCATLPQPSVYSYPQRNQTNDLMRRDQAECMLWAKDMTGFDPLESAGKGGLLGALGGALAGALAGSLFGEVGKGAGIGALAGGIGGGAYKYSNDIDGYNRAFAACMAGRGYSVR